MGSGAAVDAADKYRRAIVCVPTPKPWSGESLFELQSDSYSQGLPGGELIDGLTRPSRYRRVEQLHFPRILNGNRAAELLVYVSEDYLITFVRGFLIHVTTVTFFTWYVAGGGPITWRYLAEG